MELIKVDVFSNDEKKGNNILKREILVSYIKYFIDQK